MSNNACRLSTDSVAQTIDLGARLGRLLRGGELIALHGQLGTGKTHLVKGIARGLDAADLGVTSPTFTLVNEYDGRLPLIHVDAYRLENAAQLEALGFDEMVAAPAVVVVEWADRVAQLVAAYDPIVVRLEHRGPTQRLIMFQNLPTYVHAGLALSEP